MQGNVDALNKSAFMSMYIQQPLSKEHPVLACVWLVLLLLVEVPCAGNVEMGCAGLSSCMQRSCSWPGGEAAAALLGATAA